MSPWVVSLEEVNVKNVPCCQWYLGFSGDSVVKRRSRFDPWVEKLPWRKKRQPTPVFLFGKSHGQRSLVDYSPWGRGVGQDLETKTAPPPKVFTKTLFATETRALTLSVSDHKLFEEREVINIATG